MQGRTAGPEKAWQPPKCPEQVRGPGAAPRKRCLVAGARAAEGQVPVSAQVESPSTLGSKGRDKAGGVTARGRSRQVGQLS